MVTWSQRDHERGYKPAAGGSGQDGTGTPLRYPRATEPDYFDQEASGRKQARLLSGKISRRATWIDAKGQKHLNERLRTNNNDRRRLELTQTQAIASNCRRTMDNNGWALAGLPDDPAPSPAEATGPITLVPDAEQRWSFHFNEPEASEVDEYLAALRSEMSVASRRPARTASTAPEGANAKVCCPSERMVGTVGEGDPSPVAVEASSAPAHRGGASQPRSVPVFTGAPPGSSTGEGVFLVDYPVPESPRAGQPQGGPTAALESRKEGSDQGVDISPAPDTAQRPADESTSCTGESHAEPTITTFEQFIAENGSEQDHEPTAVATDTPRDDMPHEPPEGSLPNGACHGTQHPTPHTFHPSPFRPPSHSTCNDSSPSRSPRKRTVRILPLPPSRSRPCRAAATSCRPTPFVGLATRPRSCRATVRPCRATSLLSSHCSPLSGHFALAELPLALVGKPRSRRAKQSPVTSNPT